MNNKGKTCIIICLALVMTFMLALSVACANNVGNPYDETDFQGGSSIGTVYPDLETDSFVMVDGVFEDSVWADKLAFCYSSGGVDVSVKTTFGSLGVYVAMSVKDTAISYQPNRYMYNNSSIELYMSRADDTVMTVNAASVRMDTAGKYEMYTGTPSSGFVAGYVPAFGKVKVYGELNSGNTERLDAELFIRWDAFGYDYAAEDFEIPDSIKLFPAYNRPEGSLPTHTRAAWCVNAEGAAKPILHYVFTENGYSLVDAENARVGDSVGLKRAKTPGWAIESEVNGKVTSTLADNQFIYLKDLYAVDYIITAKIKKESAFLANAKAGLLIAGTDRVNYSYLLNFSDSGSRKEYIGVKNIESTAALSLETPYMAPVSDGGSYGEEVRLTAVKQGRTVYVYRGDGNAEKYEGELTAIYSAGSIDGETAAGFFSSNCEATFSDYEYTTDEAKISEILKTTVARLEVEQSPNGYLSGFEKVYKQGDRADILIEAESGYRLSSIRVNDQEKFSEVKNGVLSVTVEGTSVAVVPTFEKISEKLYNVQGAVLLDNDLSVGNVSVLIVSNIDAGTIYRPVVNGLKKYEILLPNGSYTAKISYEYSLTRTFSFTVNGDDKVLSTVDLSVPYGNGAYGASQTGIWDTSVEGEVRLSIDAPSNENTIYLKTGGGTKFMFSAVITSDGSAWGDDPAPKAGLVLNIGGKFITFLTDASVNSVARFMSFTNGWQNYTGGDYTGKTVKDGVKLTVVRDGDMFYGFVNDIYVFSANYFLIETENADIGLYSVASLATYTNIEYVDNVNEIDEYVRRAYYTVTIENYDGGELAGGSVDAPKRVLKGERLTLTFLPEEGNHVRQLYINGENRLSDLFGNTLSFTPTTDILVKVQFVKAAALRTVSGSYEYKNGLYSEGDIVSVMAGGRTGVVDTLNKTFTIELYAEQVYDIILTSSRYQNAVLQNVEVGATDIELNTAAQFKYFKFSETVTDNQASTGKVGLDKLTSAYFEGFTATGDFIVKAKIDYKNDASAGNWIFAGIQLNAGGQEGEINIARNNTNPNTLKISFVNRSKWQELFIATPIEMSVRNKVYDMTVVFKNGVYFVSVDGYWVKIGLSDLNNPNEGLRALFGNADKKIGIRTVDGAAEFYDLAYSAQLPDRTASVSVKDGATDRGTIAVNGSSSFEFKAVDEIVLTVVPSTETNAAIKAIRATVNEQTSDITDQFTESNGVYTATFYSSEDIHIEVEFAKAFTVKGSYDYEEGLYADGDVVTVNIGNYSAEVDLINRTYMALVPENAGELTVALISTRYKTVTANVNVLNGDVIVPKQNFSCVKFAETNGLTDKGNGTFELSAGPKRLNLAGATVPGNSDFSITAHITSGFDKLNNGSITHLTSEWYGGGFSVKGDGFSMTIGLAATNNGLKLLIANYVGAWKSQTIDTGLPVTHNGETGYTYTLVYRALEKAYYIFVNDYCIKLDATVLIHAEHKGMLENVEKKLGIAAIDSKVVAKDIRYTFIPEAGATESKTVTATAVNGTVTINGSSGSAAVAAGGTAVLVATPQAGATLKSVTAGGKDIASLFKLENGVYMAQYKYVGVDTDIHIEFETAAG